jgi:L-iditol 2-dehydrogenase
MKALLLKEYRKLEMTDMPRPVVGPQDVLIAVGACGICGSDVHGYDGSTGRRIPPIVMGHEAAGTIAETGALVKHLHPGDRVTFDSTISCGECFFCRRGQINLCDHRRVLGVSCGDYRQHGAFAEFIAVPARICYPLPQELGFEAAAMIEAVSVAFHAVNRTPHQLSDTAIVIGAGMIGQLVIQTLRLAGCGTIIASDLDDTRLALARKHGADHAINAGSPEMASRVLELTEGRGADIAFEAVGITATVQTAMASVRKGGTVTLVGNISAQIEMPLQAAVTRELTLYGSCASSGEYPAVIQMLARQKIDVRPFISAVAPLEEGQQWFDRLYRHEPNLMKVILRP